MKMLNPELEDGNLPIKGWLDDIEDKALEQAVDLSNLPFAYHHIVLLPDGHVGYGMPIGAVMATQGVVVPNAVGVDIGCGMGAIETNLDANNITKPQLREIINNVKSLVPVGFNRHSEQSDQYKSNYSFFEKYLTLWIVFCIITGILLGKIAPGAIAFLDGLAVYVDDAPVVSIPIAVCLFFMMYPIMVKIDFGEVLKAGKNLKPVGLTLFINWAVKPFTMYAISMLFLGHIFQNFIGPDMVDYVKMPFGLDLDAGASYGAGKVVLLNGVKMLEIPLWRSYLAGCILLGIAPCTA
ncbi:hypothetical protein LCGC14_2294490, partial [marine sediment metagenome]